MASVTVVGSNSNRNWNSSPAVTLPTVQDDDVAYLLIQTNGGSTYDTTIPDGWTKVGTTQRGGNNNSCSVLARRVLVADDSGTTHTGAITGGSALPWTAAVVVLRGETDQTQVAVDTTMGTTLVAPAVTPGAADCLHVVLAGYTTSTAGSTATVAPPSGFTEQVDACQDKSGGNAGVWIGTKQLVGQSGTAQDPATLTTSVSVEGGAAWSVTIKPQVVAQDTVSPSSVVENGGNFTNVGGAASIPAALSDGSDATYVQSPDSPSGATLTVAVDELTEGDVTVKVRHAASAASPAITRKYELLDGSTVITTKSVTLPSSVTAYQFTTTSAETANITDYASLRLRITDTSA